MGGVPWNSYVVFLALTAIISGVEAQFDPDTAQVLVWYSKAAYCGRDAVRNWTCGVACSHAPTLSDVTLVSNATWGLQAFVGYDNQSHRIVVSFRGTLYDVNWAINSDFSQVPYPLCAGCLVHRGFYNAWLVLLQGILDAVEALLPRVTARGPTIMRTVLVTGHSMGGALAVHAALQIVKTLQVDSVRVYTFGQPRTGNAAFVSHAAANIATHNHSYFRVVHAADLVPHVPPRFVLGYLHLPGEVWYPNSNESVAYIRCSDSNAAEDERCSDSLWTLEVNDHHVYLGVHVDVCS